jgi:transposase-like protein
MLSIDNFFKGGHFDREIIILCVRWYLRFKLSFRDLVEMIAKRGVSLAHTTIMRWMHSRWSHEPVMKLKYATRQKPPLQFFCHQERARQENHI